MKFVPRSCPICDSEAFHSVFTDVNRREGLPIHATLVVCCHCGMQYVNPVPSRAELFRLYQNGVVDPVCIEPSEVQPVSRTPADVSPMRAMLRIVNGFLRGHPHDWPAEAGEGRVVLDFGCYDGAKLMYWYQRGWQVAGIDLNEQAVEVAKRRFPDGKFWCGDVLELEITERFDFIRTDNVVEHLLDPVTYLAALAKLLKPGGQLRIIVPNGRSISARLFGRYSYVYWMPFHLNFFSPKTLYLALENAGLSHIKCATFAPIGSWTYTQRQFLLPSGFNRRPRSHLDRLLQRLSLLNYLGETLVQWLDLGDEVFGTGMSLEGAILQ